MGRADATGPAANSAHPTTAAATDRLRLPRFRPESAFLIVMVSLSYGSQDPVARGCDQHPGTGLTTATNAGRNLNYDLWRNTHRRRSHTVRTHTTTTHTTQCGPTGVRQDHTMAYQRRSSWLASLNYSASFSWCRSGCSVAAGRPGGSRRRLW